MVFFDNNEILISLLNGYEMKIVGCTHCQVFAIDMCFNVVTQSAAFINLDRCLERPQAFVWYIELDIGVNSKMSLKHRRDSI